MRRFLKTIPVTLVAFFFTVVNAAAQGCVVCTRTAAGQGVEFGEGMNRGILYLAFLPLAILGTLGFVFWRSRQS